MLVEDLTGLEGKLSLSGVEAIAFATDDDQYDVGDLTGYEGTAGADTLAGGDHDSMIAGLAGNDLLHGGGGNDTIDGGEDDDTLYGDDGDDVLQGGDGADILHGGAGYDTIDGGDGADVAHYAGASADYWIAFDPSGALVVGDLAGDEGWDMLTSVETLHFAGDNISIALIDVPALGTAGDDALLGSARADALWGLAGNDSLDGLGGDDQLNGGDGDDLYLLGAGNDDASDDSGDDAYLYALGEGADSITDAAGTDYLAFAAGITPEDVIVAAVGEEDDSYILTFIGSAGSVTLWSAALADNAIEEVRFDDETVWTAQNLHDMAYGQLPMSAPAGGGERLFHGSLPADLFMLGGQIDGGAQCQIA